MFDIVRCMCTCRYGVSGFPTIKFFPMTNKDGESVSVIVRAGVTLVILHVHVHVHVHVLCMSILRSSV